jgi:hypothetical protein
VVRPLGPLVAAPILQVSLAAPFVIAGALKSAYDLTLYALFRRRPAQPSDRSAQNRSHPAPLQSEDATP